MKKRSLRLTEEAKKLLLALQENVSQLIHGLRHKRKFWQVTRDYLHEKPWYIVVGPEHGGKSSLIQHADLSFNQIYSEENKYCQIWQSKEAVFIEIQGKFISSRRELSLWKPLCNIIKKHRGKPLDGILLCLNLPELLQQPKAQAHRLLHTLQLGLDIITHSANHPIPTYVILTHIDLLKGFYDYFGDLSQEERQQSWGFVASESSRFEKDYEHLLQRLHDRVIWRLHQVRQEDSRARIQDFPYQIESCQSILQVVISILQIHCRGLFFTSVPEHGVALDRLGQSISKHLAVSFPQEIHHRHNRSNRAYFSNQLLQHIIPVDRADVIRARGRGRRDSLFMASCALVSIVSLSALTVDFWQQWHGVTQAQTTLAHYQALPSVPTGDVLEMQNALQTLNDANQDLQVIHNNRLTRWFFPQLAQLKSETYHSYRATLQHALLPYLQQELEKSLASLEQANPEDVYTNLKIYLMLADPSELKGKYVEQWFVRTHPDHPLTAFLPALFQQTLPGITLKPDRVEGARNLFKLLPRPLLAYLIIHDDYPRDEFFARANFPEIYSVALARASRNYRNGNWVTGSLSTDPQPIDGTMTSQLHDYYLADYKKYWSNYIYNALSFMQADLDTAAQVSKQLTSGPNRFTALIQRVQENTSPLASGHPLASVFNPQIANEFLPLKTMTPERLQGLQQIFADNKKIFTTILDAPDNQKQAFEFVKNSYLDKDLSHNPVLGLQETAKLWPDPIKTWLNQLGQLYWQILVSNAMVHINQQWQTQIYPDYQTQFVDRYPFVKTAKEDVNPEIFSHFFKPEGKLEQFFADYLAPFVNRQTALWELKSLGGTTLPISHRTLELFQRGKIISSMFFADPSKPMQVSFSLRPRQLSPSIRNVTLIINEQKLFDYQGSKKANKIVWQISGDSSPVSLTFEGAGSHKQTQQYPGPWGWLRLLDQSFLTQQQDTQHHEVTFNINRDAAEYELVAAAINPFIPDVIEQFSLNKTLSEG
jgi:type VI secretion system protein ImpL